MVTIRSVNDIILSMIDLLRLSQPNADSKPGTVIRDVLIDAPSAQMGLIYDELGKVSTQQSLRLVTGTDLDKLAKNFGITRNKATASSGVALLTFNVLQATIGISKGDLVTATNGFAFTVLNGVSINPAQSNFYKSVATKFQNDLNFVGIQDQFAVEVTTQATTVGVQGNISKYTLNRTSIPGISNVTNVAAFTGGSNQEDDATFRNRILSVFSGSSVGTALGYKSVALATSGVRDAYVVTPGDPLMTRDGTVTTTDNQGNITVVSEGSGGKVDVVILGTELTENIDSFIYHDKSNKNDPTDAKNIVVLGQIAADANKTITRKRIDDIANDTLPEQPVDSILQVTGSISGTNFEPKTTDSFGRVSGNYELQKDTGVFGGSPWGFDSFHWISDRISGFQEDRVKGKTNGQDALTFPDVLEIPQVQQNISITNENSTVLTSNRSLVQLLHTPATAVTRVFNVNTGERYTVTNQNPNGTGSVNTSGTIQISGNTLPSASDVLQVDYTWIVSYDQYADYDGRVLTSNPRPVTDSVDWGYSNLVRMERQNFALNSTGTFFTGSVVQPISSVVTANVFTELDGYVSLVSSGIFAGRLSVVLTDLPVLTNTVDNIYLKNTFSEIYKTAQGNGSFSNASTVVGASLEYITTVILPQDTRAQVGDPVTAIINTTDVFNTVGSVGSFTNNQVTIPAANITTTAHNIVLKVVYIANIQTLEANGITSFPISRVGNGFLLSSGIGFNNVNVTNTIRREFQAVQKNLSNQLFVELSVSSLDTSLLASQIVSIIRLSDEVELWNADNPGTVVVDSSTNNYQLILSGFNTPNTGDKVLVVYFADDTARFQPFTFANKIIERDLGTLQFDTVSNKFIVDMHDFVSSSGVTFQILEPNTDIIWADGYDGYIIPNSPDNTAIFGSGSVNFGGLVDASSQPINILFKKIRILNDSHPNNNNVYDILGYSATTNTLTIGNNLAKITDRQVSIIRILDGQDLWSDSGTIDLTNNRLLFPKTSNASVLDGVLVLFYKSNNLRQAATKLSINITDQVINTGVLSVSGTTITKATNIVFTATATGLKQNLLAGFRIASGLNSNATIPSNVRLVKVAKLEKVTTASTTSSEVLTVEATLDVGQTVLSDNSYFLDQSFIDLTLGAFDFVLPNTTINTTPANKISIGDRLRITFYYATTGDLENVSFTRNGTLYTNKLFALINKVYIASGFNVSKSAKATINSFNQPTAGSRYKASYDYLAPKPNERISIRYNFNKLIGDTTFNIEKSRPINADVLAREAKQILVDATLNVVISSSATSSAAIILQNVKDSVVAAINATGLGVSFSGSNLVDTAFSVSGIAGARILAFNVSGKQGQVLSINAHNDQYLVANNIVINQESS